MRNKVKSAVAIFAATVILSSGLYATDIYAANIMTDLTAGAGKKEVSVSVYANTRVIKNSEVKTDTRSPGGVVSATGSSSSSAYTSSSSMSGYVSGEVSADRAGISDDSISDEDNEYKDFCITTSESDMEVREEPSDSAELVGYMYKNCVGEIIEQRNGWSHIESGELEGWTRNTGLFYGDEAEDRIAAACMQVAVINAETLRVRAEASQEADINALLGLGDEVEVIDTDEEGWTEVEYEDGTSGTATGYVSNEFITLKKSYKTGESLEEIKDREEKAEASRKAAEEKKAEEEAEAKEKKEKEEKVKAEEAAKAAKALEESVSQDKSVSDDKTETPEKEEAAETTEEKPRTETETAVNTGAVAASANDEVLLAALIQCECNGSYEAQLAVGAVVMNRVKTGYGSISNAIYAPHQFGPASSGKLAATLASGAISATAMQAAHDAISGISNVGNARYFRNVSSGHAGIVIGNHVYW